MRQEVIPQVSVVIPWCNRDEIYSAMHENSRYLTEPKAEVLIINCGGDLRQDKLPCHDNRYTQHIVTLPTPFNKALAINIGAAIARAPFIFILDADIVMQSNLLKELHSAIDDSSFVTVAGIVESHEAQRNVEFLSSTSAHRRFVLRDGRQIEVITSRITYPGQIRKGTGLLFTRTSDFRAIGGMNSEIVGWGWEDNDVIVRLQMVLNLKPREIGSAMHLTHSDDKRFLPSGISPSESDDINFAKCLARYEAGLLQGTMARDAALWKTVVEAYS
jgi:glycosyltransferase involved in cell wall biosynthesis